MNSVTETQKKQEPAAAPTPLRERAVFPVLYMFAITFLLTAILVGLARATQARVQANRQVRFERAVLQATVPDIVTAATPAAQVHRLFGEYVGEARTNAGGVYSVRREDGTVVYGIPFAGRGFWDTIRGVIGVGSDRRTVAGFAVYEHGETPGLGGEITKPYFRDRLVGYVLADGPQPLITAPTAAAAADGHGFEAVTGATQTSRRLCEMMNAALQAWRAGRPQEE